MYLTVFRNRKRPDMDRAAYEADNARMEELAAAQPGFISIKGFVAEDGEVVAISEWQSEEMARAWGSHPEHARVQARGRSDYYDGYTLYSCTDPKVRRFGRTEE
ncbi:MULTISPECIES: antibiotic biosynthesis monooxygenase [unclassified Novosphingobium]|uniref:antibiotic biosynthesis monooxygenase family protein n=1 Tax=unclassified Novosphingobium TaxID=2644732 RepID=UPI000EBD14DA|nr:MULTISPECIES: antibiotic biosynthesis monooxygenase [unclassified Novosphingobium]HCF24162.1 polysaccharide biosynthesis protein [Novosphingobium sp.]HQV02145.1 antibiotic biosynthesis monooxygenase [Novosphingobium sp.]